MQLDYAITLCAEEVCPIIYSNAQKLHWLNVDPANKNFNKIQLIESFTSIRKDLYNLLKKFIITESIN